MLRALTLRRAVPVLFLAVLCLPAVCRAEIIYGSGPVSVTINRAQKIDLAGDAAGAWDDFSFGVNAFQSGFMFNVDSYVGGGSAGTALVAGDPALSVGAAIDGSLTFASSQVLFHSFSSSGPPVGGEDDTGTDLSGIGGPWAFVDEGYLGLQMEKDGLTYFGWARAGVGQGSLTIYEWAFQNMPDTPITAGDVPEPATMTLLAGCLLAALRRKRR